MIGPALAGVLVDGGHGTGMFAGLVVACGAAGVAATRLGRRLSPEVDLVALSRADPDG